MSQSVLVVEDNKKTRTRYKLDPDVLVELVWLDLKGRVPRSAIEPAVKQLMTIYKDSKINTILPIIVERVANRFVRE